MTGRRLAPLAVLLVLLSVLSGWSAWAGSPDVPDPTCVGCGATNGIHSGSCPYMQGAGGGSSGSKSHGLSSEAQFKVQMTGMIFESLLMSLFSDGSGKANAKAQEEARQKAAALAAQQAAAEQRAQAAAAQAAYDRMMKSYKILDGSQGVAFKSLSDTALGFKSLGGSDEAMAAGARKGFDTAGEAGLPGMKSMGDPTPFFGDTMPVADITLLVEPEKDPRVVDLREAETFIVKSLKDDEQIKAAGEQAGPADEKGGEKKDKPAPPPAECEKMGARLQGLVSQRNKFHKTVLFAREQLDTWEQANRNALLAGVKDGLEYFAGQYLEALANRGKAADRLRALYEKNSAQMARDGLDTAAIAQKIERLKSCSSAGQASELASGLNDWQTFAKDGVSSLLANLASSDAEVRELMNDPRVQKYLTADAPELNALLDLSKIAASGKVFGKWVAKKIPLVAGLEISIKQLYNATDWYLSFQRIAESNQINGQVMAAARSLQNDIDETRLAYQGCPGR